MVTLKEYVDRKAEVMLEIMRTQADALDIEESGSWNFNHFHYNIFRQSEILDGFCRLAQRVGIDCRDYLEEARKIQQPYLNFRTRVA